MPLALSGVHDTTVQVAAITTIGLIVVAVIGVYTAKITAGARKEAIDNASAAAISAEVARDYVAALEAKDALNSSLEERLNFVERENDLLRKRVTELERREDEHAEQRRAAGLIERSYSNEIAELRAAIGKLGKTSG